MPRSRCNKLEDVGYYEKSVSNNSGVGKYLLPCGGGMWHKAVWYGHILVDKNQNCPVSRNSVMGHDNGSNKYVLSFA